MFDSTRVGLDNTAADGSAAFHTVEMIVDNLEKGGLTRKWCVDVKGKLRDAKRYLKTGYRVHCKSQRNPNALTIVVNVH